MDYGRLAISRAVTDKNIGPILERGLTPEMMPTPEDRSVLAFVLDFYKKHRDVPSPQAIENQFPGYTLGYAPDPTSFYVDKILEQFVRVEVQETLLNEAKGLVGKSSPFDVLDRLRSRFGRLSSLGAVSLERDIAEGAYDRLQAYEERKNNVGLLGIPTPWPSLDDLTQGWQKEMYVGVAARPKTGKAQPLTSKVLTETGFKLMGEIKVGDRLASVDGAPSVVTGVYPQGKKPVYRFTFEDGRTAEASDEHLWEVHFRGWEGPRILTTLEISELLTKKRYQKRLSIRMFSGEFGTDDGVTMDPYVLGALLGDGCFVGKALGFSNGDSEILENLRRRLSGVAEINHYSAYDYGISCGGKGTSNILMDQLREMGLWGLKSEEKFIPEAYLSASVDSRWELIRGLMDTDGWAAKSGSAYFSTSSPRMAEQFVELVRSLGGRAKVKRKSTTHKDTYVVRVTISEPARLFSVSRKRERLEGRGKPGAGHLVIESVEFIGEQECQCISVSHPSNLYVTDNYVVTHNTWFLLRLAHKAWKEGYNVLFFNKEVRTDIMEQRFDALEWLLPYKRFREGMLTSAEEQRYRSGLLAMEKKPPKNYLKFIHGVNTVSHIAAKVDEYDPDIVFIDGAYLLVDELRARQEWERQKNLSRAIKALSQETTKPIIISIQLGRGGDIKQRTTRGGVLPITMADVAGSDAFAQDVDLLMGLEQTEDMRLRNELKIIPLAVREAAPEPILVGWDFETMKSEDFGVQTTVVEADAEEEEILDFDD